ncbi:hypothetical protein P154DRAFT_623884 [Amniculicola lignicola CBS 123094]|uniref:Uncharacterized protein n=1 Tax=Amniculicola lignicola CBS 123094 TaxID=1392246 RepID=A0A6A5W152_9PLEO|nr:hypothetical protein P154DRAFT_623884 [Amniculicola lignicola CBS 123094]
MQGHGVSDERVPVSSIPVCIPESQPRRRKNSTTPWTARLGLEDRAGRLDGGGDMGPFTNRPGSSACCRPAVTAPMVHKRDRLQTWAAQCSTTCGFDMLKTQTSASARPRTHLLGHREDSDLAAPGCRRRAWRQRCHLTLTGRDAEQTLRRAPPSSSPSAGAQREGAIDRESIDISASLSLCAALRDGPGRAGEPGQWCHGPREVRASTFSSPRLSLRGDSRAAASIHALQGWKSRRRTLRRLLACHPNGHASALLMAWHQSILSAASWIQHAPR